MEDGGIGYDLRPIARRYTVDNAWEALAKLPGVVEKDWAFQLTGQTVTVILNGKTTTMTGAQLATLLKNTPVNRVEKVSGNVSVAYTGSYSPSGKGYSTTQGSFQNSIVGNDGRNFLHNASFNYMSGFGLQMGGDYTYYKLRKTQGLDAGYTDGGHTSMQMESGQRVDRYKVYADRI